jgi:hypothetical protein
MSCYGVPARLPFDDDHEDNDEMDLFEVGGGDSKMLSPSTSKVVSGPPAFPPKPVTPTKGTGKGKRSSAATELTPHGPCTGPSLAGPSATSSQALKAPRVSQASSQASAASPAPPACSFLDPPPEEPIPPPCHEHTGNLLKVLDHSIDILGEWLGKSWSTPQDQMCLTCSICPSKDCNQQQMAH